MHFSFICSPFCSYSCCCSFYLLLLFLPFCVQATDCGRRDLCLSVLICVSLCVCACSCLKLKAEFFSVPRNTSYRSIFFQNSHSTKFSHIYITAYCWRQEWTEADEKCKSSKHQEITASVPVMVLDCEYRVSLHLRSPSGNDKRSIVSF